MNMLMISCAAWSLSPWALGNRTTWELVDGAMKIDYPFLPFVIFLISIFIRFVNIAFLIIATNAVYMYIFDTLVTEFLLPII
jgi:hypothetical protein